MMINMIQYIAMEIRDICVSLYQADFSKAFFILALLI